METCEYNFGSLYFQHRIDLKPYPDNYPLHTHLFCEIYCFIRGDAIYHVEGSTYALKPGTVILMRPGEAHYLEINPSEPYQRCWIHFNPALLDGADPGRILLQPFFDRPLGENNKYDADELAMHTMRYFEQMCLPAPTTEEQRIALYIHFLNFLDALRQTFIKRNAGEGENDVCRSVVHFINENLESDLSLQDICGRFYISRSQINKLFKEATGETVWNYVIIKRLVDARQRILAGEPPQKVCESYGGWDYSAFYRSYKKRFGISPKADFTAKLELD